MSSGTPHYLEDCPTWKIPNSPGWTLQGHSVAGERTGFHIPELRLFFDAGLTSHKSVTTILLTHSHSDHSHNIPTIAMGQCGDLSKRPMVYCPTPVEGPLRTLARASQALNDCAPLGDKEELNVHPVQPGDIMSLQLGKKNNVAVDINVVPCYHRVPCVGYTLCKVANKLRPELVDLPKADLAAKRRAGEDISVKERIPVITFLGDTTEEVFADGALLDVPIIVIECTGVAHAVAGKAAERGHTHWDTLRPIVAARPSTTFVLIHFSASLTDAEIVDHIRESGLNNIVIWRDSGIVDLTVQPQQAPSIAPSVATAESVGGAGGGAAGP